MIATTNRQYLEDFAAGQIYKSGLLRVDAVHVDLARVLQRGEHGAPGDLVELDSLGILQAERFLEVP